MAVFFPIDDLRTLVARALERDNYLPNQSKRIRAVPDIRTIRYYTTLGLIDRPAEMRGRTVLYEPRHVMQLVAIKRLQAANQTLSDVQSRLVGITNNQLTTLADLPQDFWESAERYLARKHTSPGSLADSPGATENELKSPSEDNEVKREFWDQTAALPHSATTRLNESSAPLATGAIGSSDSLRHCVIVDPLPGVTILIEGSSAHSSVDVARLRSATQPLLNELIRQGLLKADSIPPEVAP